MSEVSESFWNDASLTKFCIVVVMSTCGIGGTMIVNGLRLGDVEIGMKPVGAD